MKKIKNLKDPKKLEGLEKILVVDDNRIYTNRLSKFKAGFDHKENKLNVLVATDKEGARTLLNENPDIKLVLLNGSMERNDFENILGYIRKDMKTCVQIVTISGSIENIPKQEIVDKYSPADFIDRQGSDDRVKACIIACLDKYDKLAEIEIAKISKISKTPARLDIESLMGKGKVISEVFEQVEKYAKMNNSILIEGATGTGKELIANYLSKLSDKKIVPVDCSTLVKEVVASELFGSVKGAFTDAVNKKGFVEEAEGGILFLDEINYLPLDTQAKLLRLIENKVFTKVGDPVEHKANVRIIAAGNESFEELIANGKFREDLYERFSGIIYLPTLKERIEDIVFFIDRFLLEKNKALDKTVTISSEARKALITYDWPRNIRQLKNFIEVLVVKVDIDRQSGKGIIQLQLVQECFNRHTVQRQLPQKGFNTPQENKTENVPEDDYTLQAAYDCAAKTAILRALDKTGGNNTKTIELLCISHGKYFYLKKKLELK
jgi:two-component system response regulator HydG